MACKQLMITNYHQPSVTLFCHTKNNVLSNTLNYADVLYHDLTSDVLRLQIGGLLQPSGRDVTRSVKTHFELILRSGRNCCGSVGRNYREFMIPIDIVQRPAYDPAATVGMTDQSTMNGSEPFMYQPPIIAREIVKNGWLGNMDHLSTAICIGMSTLLVEMWGLFTFY